MVGLMMYTALLLDAIDPLMIILWLFSVSKARLCVSGEVGMGAVVSMLSSWTPTTYPEPADIELWEVLSAWVLYPSLELALAGMVLELPALGKVV